MPETENFSAFLRSLSTDVSARTTFNLTDAQIVAVVSQDPARIQP